MSFIRKQIIPLTIQFYPGSTANANKNGESVLLIWPHIPVMREKEVTTFLTPPHHRNTVKVIIHAHRIRTELCEYAVMAYAFALAPVRLQ